MGHDIAFPAMLRFLPVGWMGLMLGGLIAANSSTILTHLNWGASYLVHDFYRRFIKPGEERETLCDGRPPGHRLAVRGLVRLVFALDTAKQSFNIILQIGAGTGLLVSDALVLVASDCVVRDRGHEQFVRHLDRCS
jgi:solute:Na+ symporter, SSS family